MSTARRLAKGCGCGCGLLIIVLGLLGWGGYAFLSGIVSEAQEAEAVMEEVHDSVGRVADYCPRADGAVPPERMEAFLRVRELTKDARVRTDADLTLLSPREGDFLPEISGLLGRLVAWGIGVSKVEAGTSLVPGAIAFSADRGRALIEVGMGPGEYLYIYALAYYVALGKSPADGPAFNLVEGDDGNRQRESARDEFDIRESRREDVLRKVNQALLPMLRCQVARLDEEGVSAEADPWRARLEAEVEAVENDRFRIPWRDGLPGPIEASIIPYRGRLESSYSAMCNPLEALTGMDP